MKNLKIAVSGVFPIVLISLFVLFAYFMISSTIKSSELKVTLYRYDNITCDWKINIENDTIPYQSVKKIEWVGKVPIVLYKDFRSKEEAIYFIKSIGGKDKLVEWNENIRKIDEDWLKSKTPPQPAKSPCSDEPKTIELDI